MKKPRVKLGVFLLLFLPFFGIFIVNLLYASYLLESYTTVRQIWTELLVLSLVFFLFLIICKYLPKKFTPFSTAIFVFSYLLYLFGFAYVAVYQAPDLSGTLANLSVIPGPFLCCALWVMAILMAILMFFMGIDRKAVSFSFCILVMMILSFVAGKELVNRYKLAKFFGDCKEGKIIFISPYKTKKQPYVFHLAERKFEKFPKKQFEQISRRLPKWSVEAFSPDSNFKVYEYAYDRDDLSKIFVTNPKTGKTILLAAGENPIWIK